MTQNRWKSPVFWAEVAVAIIALVSFFVKFDVTFVEKVVSGVITLLMLFGVLNNPTNKTGY